VAAGEGERGRAHAGAASKIARRSRRGHTRERRERGAAVGLQRRPTTPGMRDGGGPTAFCRSLRKNCWSLNSSKSFILKMQ
jgi:hypothetical protein